MDSLKNRQVNFLVLKKSIVSENKIKHISNNLKCTFGGGFKKYFNYKPKKTKNKKQNFVFKL